MRHFRASIFYLYVFPALLMFVGCGPDHLDSSIELQKAEAQTLQLQNNETTIDSLRDVPELKLDLPEEKRAGIEDISALSDSISAYDGKAVIGFKAPESKRLRETDGIRAAISARDFRYALQMVDSLNIEIDMVYRSFGAASVRLDPEDVFELYDHPRVDYIEFPARFHLQSTKLGEMVQSQTTPWGVDLVRAPVGWPDATGSGVKVLVIDSGMDNHSDLPDRPSANCGGLAGGGGCLDATGHGTHVSGTVMALDNTIGVVGVAPDIQDSDAYSYGACGTSDCFSNEIAAGIDFGVMNGVDVINMSLGGPTVKTVVSNAVSAAWNAGIVLVAAAGNLPGITAGSVVYPAGYNEVIGVSGITELGVFADTSPCQSEGQTITSNYGSHVSISAPFWALSTVGTSSYLDETYGFCGTSMAAPHVSGAAALLIDQNPSWSNFQVRQRLQNTANHPDNSLAPDDEYGHGVLDAGAALGHTLPITPNIDGPYQIQVNNPVQFTTTVGGGVRPYSFQWQIDYNMTGSWQNVGGDAAFYGHESFNDDDFVLRVVVTDAENNSTPSAGHWVTVSW